MRMCILESVSGGSLCLKCGRNWSDVRYVDEAQGIADGSNIGSTY
jgi:hypothetical protein